ncbi:PTPLA-domain-containing protein [Decorospora gaudefroyi]|uniref:Very-long-chain (3R)-3-hydroxyacyl-CoA dehydratase n=1 Tax=Decorospora gaudefroyi TaxID=184978 RepID=A0A6A5K8C2_9PLEO|nr:PTPLA-domain-containing protein [Decorospora gaudefroyi]
MADLQDKRTPPWHHPRSLYLTLYNALLLTLWTKILTLTLTNIYQTTNPSTRSIFSATAAPTRWTQTLSLLEILHAANGLINSPVSSTAIQTLTRTIQVWMVWYFFPDTTSTSVTYVALVLAWSVADCIRYSYLLLNMYGVAPAWLTWLRYTMFFVLYPVGIGSEWWLLYCVVEPGRRVRGWIPLVFYVCLMLYFPGAYRMYTYMMKQRKKRIGKKTRVK